jgi:hypothetical protein
MDSIVPKATQLEYLQYDGVIKHLQRPAKLVVALKINRTKSERCLPIQQNKLLISIKIAVHPYVEAHS